MQRLPGLLLALTLVACATTAAPIGPTIQYYLSTSQPACDGLKDCQTRCDQDKRGRACLEWALYALTADSNTEDIDAVLASATTQKSFEFAANLLAAECGKKDALSCLDLGNLHLQGLGVRLDQGQALSYLNQACVQGVADGCTRLGMLYQEGVAVARDQLRAKDYFQIGCDAGHNAACTLLAEAN